MKEKIAELIRCEFEHHKKGDNYHIGHLADKILALFKEAELEQRRKGRLRVKE